MAEIPENARIVVADGHGARYFRSTAVGKKFSLQADSALKPEDLLDDGPAGSRPEEQTPRQTDEATFCKQLARALHRQLLRKEYDALVLIADPQSLGQIRDAMAPAVSQTLVLELNKELTGHSPAEIAKIIAGAH